MAALNLFIVEEGLTDLRRKIQSLDTQLAKPVTEAFTDLGKRIVDALLGRAPRGQTGRLAGSIRYRINNKPVPLWVKWTANAARRRGGKGGRYGYVLNAGFRSDPRTGGIIAFSGVLGWWSGVRPTIAGQLSNLAAKIGQGLEASWQR